MFFCSKWSVGKVVDYAASLASLKNNNNVQAAKVMGALRPVTQRPTHLYLLYCTDLFTFTLLIYIQGIYFFK